MPAVDCRSGRGWGCCCLLMLPRQQTVRQRQRQRQSYRGGKHFSNLQLAYREHSTVRSVRRGEGGGRRQEVGGEASPVESRESFMHADNPRLDALPCKSGCLVSSAGQLRLQFSNYSWHRYQAGAGAKAGGDEGGTVQECGAKSR